MTSKIYYFDTEKSAYKNIYIYYTLRKCTLCKLEDNEIVALLT